MFADHLHKYIPDGPLTPVPYTPTGPIQPWPPWTPIQPLPQPPAPQPSLWTREQYEEAMDILRRIKEMEDRLGGCPCEEPGKLDFLKAIEERLTRLEQAQKEAEDGREPSSEAHLISE